MVDKAGRIGPLQVATFSAAALPVGALVTTLGVYLTNFYAAHVGLPLALVGLTFTAVRLADLILDPLLGVAMDHTHTGFGRFRPWLAASAPILLVAAWMLYFPMEGVGLVYLALWLVVLYVGYSMLTLSQAAWGAALVTEYHHRSRVYGWIQAVGVVGAVGVLAVVILVPLLWPQVKIRDVPLMGAFILVTVALGAVITTFFAPEPMGERPKHSFVFSDYVALLSRPEMLRILGADLFCTLGPAITAPMYLFFFEQARGYTPNQTNWLLQLYIVAGFFGPVIWSFVANRFGKHQTIRIAAFCYVVAQTTLLLLPKAQPFAMSFSMFSVGFTASAFGFLIRAMVADVSDEVRLETGKDRTALLYALVTSTGKIGSTVSVGVAYGLLPLFGFIAKEGYHNTPGAIWGLEACYVAPPVICVLIGGLCTIGYALDEKRHAQIRAALGGGSAAAATPEINVAGEPGVAVPGE
jgi:Na+/melibiose symporter-like transporter